jgi:hypothetical protein
VRQEGLQTVTDALALVAVPSSKKQPDLYYLYITAKSMVLTWQNTVSKTLRYVRIRVMREDSHDVPLHPLETYLNHNLQHALPLQKVFVFFYRIFVDQRTPPQELRLNALQLNIWKQITNHLEELQGEFPNVDMKHEHTHHEPDLSVIQLAGVRFLQAS